MNRRSRSTRSNSEVTKSRKLSNTKQHHKDHEELEIRSPYEVDERVLCYEPDPLKCKVLYDAKVLKVAKHKDELGTSQFQYLIHFQGWNSSWDRYVADDLIMKDTEENRELQAMLNDLVSSQLKKGKQKLKTNANGDATVKKAKPDVLPTPKSDVGYIQIENAEDATEGVDNDVTEFDIQVSLPQEVTDLLEKDYFYIHEESKLPVLPSPISVFHILEKFVKCWGIRLLERWYKKYRWELLAAREARAAGNYSAYKHFKTTLPSHSQGIKEPDELIDVLNEVDCLRQFAAGFKVMFDWYVGLFLLYPGENGRFEKCIRRNPTVDTSSWNAEIPECLNFSHDDLAENPKVTKLATSTKPSRSDAARPNGLLSRRAGTSKSETADEVRERTTEINYRKRINSYVKMLVEWTLEKDSRCIPSPAPSLIYGLPHLLRLFVKIPNIFAKMDAPRSRLQEMAISSNSLLSFIMEEYKEEHMFYERVSRPVRGRKPSIEKPSCSSSFSLKR